MRPSVPLLAGLVALAAATALAAPAAAQDGSDGGEQPLSLQVTVEPVAEPMDPRGAPAEAILTVQATCPATANHTAPLDVALRVADAPPWVNATLRPATLTLPAPCADAPVGANATLVLRALPPAPAFTTETVTVRAEALGRNESTEASTAVVVGFLGAMDVSPRESSVTARPQQHVEVPLTVTNNGNAPIAVSFSKGGGTHPGFQVVVPPPVTVASPLDGASNRRTVIVSIQTPYENGFVDEEGGIVLDVVSHYALDSGLPGPTRTAAIHVATAGFYAPAAGAAPALVLLGLAAVAARRLGGARRED